MKPNASSQGSIEELAQSQMVRLVERDRSSLTFSLDGSPAIAREGDTILTAVLTLRRVLALPEPDDGPRAGFCLMGACQECWVAIDGAPVRACGTLIAAGMRVATHRRST